MNPWDERYSQSGFYYGTEPNDFLKEQSTKIIKGGKVLCLAEGEGRNAVFLAQQGFQVTAVDSSKVGLEKLKHLASEKQVQIETLCVDLKDYVIEANSWDAIVSIWCHVPQPLRSALHASVVKGLNIGGVLILEAYHPRQLEYKTGGPPVAELMMTLQDLRHELTGLEWVIGREMDREIHEGVGHSGLSAVTQVLGIHNQ